MSDSTNSSLVQLSNQNYPWHQNTWQKFAQAKAKNQLPHAILISGEEGIAKVDLAKRMAKSLICINSFNAENDACGQCPSCKTYESIANPDYIEIGLLEDKQQIGVDQIRSLSEFLNYSRSYNTNRVVILNPVERMNLNAANSLLKSLEEPSANTVIILVTSKISHLLPTIRSRCQLYNLSTPTKVESTEWLQQNTSQDSSVPIDALLEISGNKPLQAININQEDIDSRNQFFQDLITTIQQSQSITDVSKKWEKFNLDRLLNWQITLVQNSIKTSLSDSFSSQISTTNHQELTQHLSVDELWQLYYELTKQKQYIHTSVNPLMFLENMIMLWTKTI